MKLIKYSIAFILFSYILQLKIGIGQYYHNDGVTIFCSKFTWLELLHPGMAKTLACSYDHQPFYHYLVKLLGPITNYNLYFFQIFNVIFVSLAAMILFNLYLEDIGFIASVGVSLVFFTTYPILYEIQELRMYSLFLLSSTLLIWVNSNEKFKFNWLHLLSFYNFYLYIIPLTAYLISNLKHLKEIILKNKIIFSILFFGILYKTPYVIFWRVKERYQVEPYQIDFFKNQIMAKIFEGNILFTSLISIFVLISMIIFFKVKNVPQKKYHLTILILAFITLFTFTIILRSQEIEWRYFCFIYPSLSYIGFIALKEINHKWIQRSIGGILIILSFNNSQSMFIRGEKESLIHQRTIDFIMSNIDEGSVISVDYNFFYEAYIDVFIQQRKKIYYRFSEIKQTDIRESLYISSIQSEKEHNEECEKRFGNCTIILNEPNIIGNQRTIISQID